MPAPGLAYSPNEYAQNARRILPFHQVIHAEAIDVVLSIHPAPTAWLDTGCGPGWLVEQARQRTPTTRFTLADPEPAMLDLARQRLPDFTPDQFVQAPSAQLPAGRYDAVTAILCHHYADVDGRRRSIRRCREVLAPGGVLVIVENVRAETEGGHAIQRRRWASWQQREGGRTAQQAEAHLAREGTSYLPIPVSLHLRLLQEEGFATVELFWRSYAQAGFLAVL
jgi:ubiquinone/menaquinone biosynthesis C-methylase UbiE